LLIIYDQVDTMMIMGTYGSFILARYGRDGSVNLVVYWLTRVAPY
jgi:hypothetical protein